jgi:hypothetical protein
MYSAATGALVHQIRCDAWLDSLFSCSLWVPLLLMRVQVPRWISGAAHRSNIMRGVSSFPGKLMHFLC